MEAIYEKQGNEAVLLFHAYSGTPNDVRMLARLLERNGYAVYAPVFSGHGTNNPEDILSSSPNHWRKEAEEAFQFLKNEGFEKIYVFGLSMGGIFATYLMEKNDPALVAGGVFSSPIYPLEHSNVPSSFVMYAKFLLEKQNIEQTVLEKRLTAIEKEVVQQVNEIKEVTEMISSKLNKIQQPFFIAQAGLDEMIPAKDILKSVTQLVAENKRVTFQWYEKSSHVLTVGKQKKEFEEDVLAFIQREGAK